MRMQLHVDYANGSGVDVTVSAPDYVRFEEKYDRSVTQLESNFRLTDLCFLAWSGLSRVGKTDLDFDAWVNTIDGVGGAGDSKDIVPLESTPRTG